MMSKYFVMMPNARIFPNDAPKNNDWHGCRVKLEKICKDQDRQGFLIHRTISLDEEMMCLGIWSRRIGTKV